MRFFYLLFLSSLLSISINAQITITPGGTATSIINTLVSNGIVVTNPIINCGSASYGSYTGNLQAGGLGLSNGGIVLTTGSAAAAAGPNNSMGYLTAYAVDGYDYQDPQLISQPGAGTPPPEFDNCRLEFDMSPICSSFNISFVFGSEEYPEFVNADFNDGFGIFVTGPNPLGGNYTNYNMARLSNGQLVSIDNVNSNLNNSYYNTNSTGVMQYDGYTDGLTAQLAVIPCSTYHIKIIIADAGDEVFDSGIFLGAGSFSCSMPALSITASPSTICAGASTTLTASTAASGGTYLWSPGGATTQSINVNPSTTTTYTCFYTFSSCSVITANATVTVSPIITPIFTPIGPYCSGATIPAFSTSSTNGIFGTWAPAINNTATTTYTFTPSAGECASTSTMSIEITPNILPSFPQVGPYCYGATIPPLTTTSTNGFSGTWLPEINNTATTTYTFTPDAGLCATTQTMSIAITLSILPTIDIGSDITACGTSTTLTAPSGFDSYLWSNGATTNTTTVTSNGTYSCAVSEGGCNASDTVDVTLIDATISASDSVICAGDTVTLSVDGNISNAGNLIVSSNETFYTDNVRTQISAASSAGQASVYVAQTTGLLPNDRVLLIVMQGLASNSSSQPEVGNYEFATIQSINGNQLTFTQVLQHSYYEPSLTKCQLIRVPTYENVSVSGTLTCNPWDGLTGGVSCFFANGQITINANGSINADGKGFRGGQSVTSWGGGYQGESYYGSGIIGFESNNGGGGGGNAEWCHSGQGGGGGGYVVAGETAPSPCFSCGGGWTFGSCSNSGYGGNTVSLGTDKIILGSGGGSGGVDGDNPDWGGFGGNGGGIIFIKANQLSGVGMISSIGLAGDDSPGETGGGGGGSGGLIIIESPNPNPFDGSVSAGNGGKLNDSRRGGNGSNGIYRELNILEQTWYNVVWSNGATNSSINVSPTTTTTYTCTITANGVSCTDSVTVVINNPTIDLGSDITVCGTATTLTVPTGNDSYVWSNGGTTNSTTVNASGTYECTVTQGLCSASDTIDVTLIDATITASDSVICAGDSVTLSVPQVGTTGSEWQLHYLQDFENTINSEWNTSSTITYNASTVLGNFGSTAVNLNLVNLPQHDSLKIEFDLYLLDSWDGNGQPDIWSLDINGNTIINTTFACSSFASDQSYPGNYPSSYTAGTGADLTGLPSYCQGDPSTKYIIAKSVLSSSSNLNTIFSASNLQELCDESWAIDNVKIYLYSNNFVTNTLWSNGTITSSIDVSPTTTTTYTCTVTTNGVSCTDSVTVVVNNPTIDIGSDITACGTSTTLAAPTGYDSYLWSNGGTTNTTTVTSNGTYSCAVSEGGCNASDTVDVTLIDATISASDSVICAGDTVTLSVQTVTGSGLACQALPTNLQNGLVGNWPFCGNANDESGNGNNGTVNGATLTTDRFGSANSAYSFDGDDYISTSLNRGNLGSISSVSTHFKFTGNLNLSYSAILGGADPNGTEWFIGRNANSSNFAIQDGTWNDAVVPNSNLFDSNWHHLVVSNSNGLATIYIDGTYATQAVFSGCNPEELIYFGVEFEAAGYYFVGVIDDIALYNRSLLGSEVAALSSISENTYSWSNGATTPTINVSPTTTTTYTCTTTTNGVSCPSNYTITVNNSTSSTDVQTACNSYTWIDGIIYTASNNTATFTTTNAAGCDSIITLNLTMTNSTSSTDVQTACDSYTWIDGIIYTASNNTATFTTTNAAGCDSLITLNLTITNSTSSTDVQIACDSYTWIDGLIYTSSNNTATFTIANAVGCDSLITLNLTINNSTSSTDVQIACDSYTWIDGLLYTSSNNTATFIIANAVGCDSLITLNLTINNSTSSTDVQTACDSYTWIDGLIYTASNNTATFTTTNAAGCDSLITLNLTITLGSTNTTAASACDSYFWNGTTYSSSGAYTGTTSNCVTQALNLTITPSTSNTTPLSSCGPYTWANNGQTYTVSGVYSGITVNCVTQALNLTITPSSTNTTPISACGSYTWANNGQTYTASGIYSGTTANCVTQALNLTITPSTTNTTPISACGSYNWANNGQTYSVSGVYSGTTANCISEILNLTITPSSTNTTSAESCDSYVWNGTTYSSSGVYTGTTANCVTEALNLTINPSPLASFNPSINLFTESPQLVAFTNTTAGAATYTWDFGDGASSNEINPNHVFTDNTNGQTITLVAASIMGCTSTYQISIEFDEMLIYYIPNTFTPDGDGYNQTFKPVFTSGFDPYHYEMLIYNRWGEIIFETHDVSYGWDGTYAFENSICQYGIYTYKITFKNPILDERKVVCGSFNLLK